jgi:hypothetical protein
MATPATSFGRHGSSLTNNGDRFTQLSLLIEIPGRTALPAMKANPVCK